MRRYKEIDVTETPFCKNKNLQIIKNISVNRDFTFSFIRSLNLQFLDVKRGAQNLFNLGLASSFWFTTKALSVSINFLNLKEKTNLRGKLFSWLIRESYNQV